MQFPSAQCVAQVHGLQGERLRTQLLPRSDHLLDRGPRVEQPQPQRVMAQGDFGQRLA